MEDIFVKYAEYFNKRDTEGILDLFSEKAYSLGSERNEMACGKEEIREQHQNAFDKFPYVKYKDVNILSSDKNYILGELICSDQSFMIKLRITLVFDSENKIIHLHASVPEIN